MGSGWSQKDNLGVYVDVARRMNSNMRCKIGVWEYLRLLELSRKGVMFSECCMMLLMYEMGCCE